MRTIGFIDYYLDEWHANNYPAMIRSGRYKDEFDVVLAWEKTQKEGKKPIGVWCAEQKVGQASSLEEVVEKCDCIVVLSPDNPEQHEELADLPLRSGKPVYIDKPFAPTLDAARRLFAKAEAHGTPLMSSSALRFGSEIQQAVHETLVGQRVSLVSTHGGGAFQLYAIHQLEMLVMLLGTDATRVMQCGVPTAPVMLIDYPDARRGIVHVLPGHPFQLSVQYGEDMRRSTAAGQALVINTMNDFFDRFLDGMLEFFDTGVSSIPPAQTLEIAALVETGITALDTPDTWVPVPAI